jgi:signal transduction histidine kinase
VPLYDRTDGSVIAIGEFYEDATKLHSYLAQAALRNWLVLLPGALAMLAALYLFYRHGTRIIASQGAAISAMKDDQEALTRENKEIEGNLAAARTQLRDIDELVRRRIGQELHDGPAQLLGYLTLSLENLTQVQRLKEIDSDALRAVQQAAERAQKEIRDISNRLLAAEPAGDKDETLSLRDIVAAYRERSHADVATQGLDLCDMLPRPAQRAIARIANEALNNGFKHAAAKGQQVLVAVRAGNLVVEIADDGPGLPDKATLARKADEGHRGLGGMAEQAGSIGAIIDLDSQPGQGTTVRITLPIA